MADENEQGQAVDLSALGSFDFAPSWATGDKIIAKSGRGGFRDDEAPRTSRDEGGRRRFDGAKGDRPFRRDDRPKKPFDREDREGKPFRRDRDGQPRKPFNREGRGDDRRGGARREFIKPLDAEVRVLPAQKELGGIIRKIQTGFAAYPLKQIAWFFLDHPEACHVKVTPKDPEMRFHVCKACGHSCFTNEALEAHILSAHLSDYYVAEETEVEPPTGQFGCVVKCGITGEFIGPPNLHGYNAAVREMAQKLGMDENAYRARLVTVRDQESVEAWRKGATKKTFYRLKAAVADAAKAADAAAGEPTAEGEPAAEPAPAPAFERDQAEAAFRRDIMPQLKSQSKSSDMQLDQALKSTDLPYLFAVRDAIARERRFPASLFFALRGAFHHRKLSFFRANEPRGQEFVCAAKPTPLDTEHAIPELVAVVKYVEEHPLCSVGELPPEMKGHLGWLVEKGHIVQYFNGLLALPEDHPRFRNPSPKKGAEATGTTGVSPVADGEGAVATQSPESESASAEPAPAQEPSQAEPVAAEVPAAEPAQTESVSAEAPVVEPAPTEPVAAEAPTAEVNVVEEVKKEEISNEAADQLAE